MPGESHSSYIYHHCPEQRPAQTLRRPCPRYTGAETDDRGERQLIISASYKTDIPCFYGEWFMNRLRAGYCKMANPYSRQVYRIGLTPAEVEGFVFWTKNAGPFMRYLPEIRERGYPFVVQYGINGYPRELERSVADAGQAIGHVHALAEAFGPKVVVWRYDPILFTTLTPAEYHRQCFAALARELAGATDEVVISFAQIYRKTRRNLERSAGTHGFGWVDPDDEVKRTLVRDLAGIAREHGMQLTLCAQDSYVTEGAAPARCIDAGRLAAVAGRPVRAEARGHRPACGCYRSRDIGEYDTCPQGCVYCYAVQDRERALARYRQHDPAGEFLFPPGAGG